MCSRSCLFTTRAVCDAADVYHELDCNVEESGLARKGRRFEMKNVFVDAACLFVWCAIALGTGAMLSRRMAPNAIVTAGLAREPVVSLYNDEDWISEAMSAVRTGEDRDFGVDDEGVPPDRPIEEREKPMEVRLNAVFTFLAAGGEKRCTLPHLDGRNLTWDELQENVRATAAQGLPESVVVTHLAEGLCPPPPRSTSEKQPTVARAEAWRQALLSSHGKCLVSLDNGHQDNNRVMELSTLEDFIDKNVSVMGVNMAYPQPAHAVQRALLQEMPGTPRLFASVDLKSHISLHLAGRGLQFHAHSENWLLQVTGRKAWWLGTPNDDPWHEPALPGGELDPCVALDPGLPPPPPGADVAELCVLKPGEAIFFTGGTPHATCSLDDFVLGYGCQGSTEFWPPLHRAAYKGDVEAIRNLVRTGSHVNSLDIEGRTALFLAVVGGHIPIIHLLVQSGASWETKNDWNGVGALSLAAFCRNRELVQCLMEVKAPIMTESDEMVHWAASHEDPKLLDEVLEEIASIGYG